MIFPPAFSSCFFFPFPWALEKVSTLPRRLGNNGLKYNKSLNNQKNNVLQSKFHKKVIYHQRLVNSFCMDFKNGQNWSADINTLWVECWHFPAPWTNDVNPLFGTGALFCVHSLIPKSHPMIHNLSERPVPRTELLTTCSEMNRGVFKRLIFSQTSHSHLVLPLIILSTPVILHAFLSLQRKCPTQVLPETFRSSVRSL